jgi:hypothetical protein
MSQGVFGWRTKLSGLGLLLSVVMLSGTSCPPSLNLTGGQSNQQAQATPWTITVDSPLQDTTILAGTVVQISWTVFTNGEPAKVTVFYDADNSFANGVHNLQLVDLASPGAPNRYNWSTTGLPNGTYYVGAQLSDGTTSLVAYAIGRVIVVGSVATQALGLDQLGSASLKGCVFEGFSFAGRLGDLMAGRFDLLSDQPSTADPAQGTPDGVSDIVLVSPLADSHYAEDPGVGEAYIIFGWNGTTGTRGPGWYNGAHFNVNSIGSDPNVPGLILVGPAYRTTTLGIAAVQPLADLDGDRGSELLFGMPLLVNGNFEDQDYDPCDCEPPVYFYNVPYAYPQSSLNIIVPDDHDFYGGLIWSSGYITVLASTTPNLYNPTTRLGGVVHIDEIGQVDAEHSTHPRNIDPALGVRVYPYAREVRSFDFLNNDYRFGAAVGTEDLDGDGVADWLIAEPKANRDAGDVTIGYSLYAWLWTQALPGTASSYSWPYTVPTGPCPTCDRALVYPFGLVDYVRGDELQAPNGELSNPTGLGDFNMDGIGDFAVSTPNWSAGGLMVNAGAAYLIYGRAPFGDHDVGEIKDPVVQNALPGVAVYGTAGGDFVGQRMTGLGRPNWGMVGHPSLMDFNADGLGDWVINAPGRDIPGLADVGAVAIVFGHRRLDGRFTWDQIGTADLPGVIITGANQGDRFGTWIAEAGDVNGDGSDDLLVAAPGAENPLTGAQDTGAVYIIYGPPSAGAVLNKYQALSGTYGIDELMASGPIKVQVIYASVPGHKVGPVAGAGDIDNDGYEDILIGDPVAAPLGRTDAGEVFLVFGGAY